MFVPQKAAFRQPRDEKSGLTQTDELRSYWHIHIHQDGTNWILHRRKEEEWPDITAMMVSDSGHTA